MKKSRSTYSHPIATEPNAAALVASIMGETFAEDHPSASYALLGYIATHERIARLWRRHYRPGVGCERSDANQYHEDAAHFRARASVYLELFCDEIDGSSLLNDERERLIWLATSRTQDRAKLVMGGEPVYFPHSAPWS